jgi:hypothetical protein
MKLGEKALQGPNITIAPCVLLDPAFCFDLHEIELVRDCHELRPSLPTLCFVLLEDPNIVTSAALHKQMQHFSECMQMLEQTQDGHEELTNFFLLHAECKTKATYTKGEYLNEEDKGFSDRQTQTISRNASSLEKKLLENITKRYTFRLAPV